MKMLGFLSRKKDVELKNFDIPALQDLQAVKQEVTAKKEEDENAQSAQIVPQKSKIIIFPEHSDNNRKNENLLGQGEKTEENARKSEGEKVEALDSAGQTNENEAESNKKSEGGYSVGIDNLEMKLIRMVNELDELRLRLDSSKNEILKDMQNVHREIEELSGLVKEVPKQAGIELRNLRKTSPETYHQAKDAMGQAVRENMLDEADVGILKIIRSKDRVTSLDLLDRTRAGKVCSKNTLYIRLKRLEERALITRKRANHEVFYSITEAGTKEMDSFKEKPAAAEGNDNIILNSSTPNTPATPGAETAPAGTPPTTHEAKEPVAVPA